MAARWLKHAKVQVTLAFATVMALMLAASLALGLVPSKAERCVAGCQAQGLQGQLVPVHSNIQTGSRGSPTECKCT